MIKRVFVSLICTSVAAPLTVCSAAPSDWLQFGFDPTHSGINPNEKLLSASNVHLLALKYSKTLSTPAQGSAPAQGTPVFLSNVSTSQGVIDMLFVTLNDGSLLALDAANGAQVWAKLPATIPVCGQAGQNPQCLVTSSPAIDPNRNYVYNFSRVDGNIHKFAVATGTETIDAHWPEVSSTKPDVEKGSSAITFATSSSDPNHDTYLYMTHSSFLANDGGDYQGHITAINLRTGTQIVFNAVCSDQGNIHFVESGQTSGANQNDCTQVQTSNMNGPVPAGNAGIWGRAAATYDPANDSIYVSTANGVFDPTNAFDYGGNFWGDSVLRLPAALSSELFKPVDSYTPPNFDDLMRNDTDLGSASLAIIPVSMTTDYAYTHLGIQGGKDSNIRILDLDDLSVANGPQWQSNVHESALYTASVPQENEVKTQPLVWQNPSDHIVRVIVSNDFGISAMQLTMDGSGDPQLLSTTAASWVLTGASLPHGETYGGGSPVIANNVLYYASASGLLALDPATGTILAAKTEMGISTTSPGVFHKQSPIVVNGRVYVTDENAMLWVYEGDEIFADGFD